MIWPVSVMASMTYEIKADDPEEVRKQALNLFLSDIVTSPDIDIEVYPGEEEEE